MKIAGVYSFNGGQETIKSRFAVELHEVEKVM